MKWIILLSLQANAAQTFVLPKRDTTTLVVSDSGSEDDKKTILFPFSAFPCSIGECGPAATAPIHHPLHVFEHDHHPPCFLWSAFPSRGPHAPVLIFQPLLQYLFFNANPTS